MIHNLPSPKSTRKAKRLGRGTGSGVGGHTVGRGLKGATARTGYKAPRRNFEGGQNPLSRRLPKYKGFTRGFAKSTEKVVTVQLSRLEDTAKANKKTDIDMKALAEMGLIRLRFSKKIVPKVVFDKEIKTSLNLTGIKASKTAMAAIEKAGGSVK